MIKKILFGALLISAGAITAQNLELKSSSDSLIDGRTYYIYGTSAALSATKIHVANSSASPVEFGIIVREIANPTASDWQVCFGTDCFIANDGVATDQSFVGNTVPAIVPANGAYDGSKVAPFSFGWSSGDWGVWKVKVSNVSNINDNQEAYVVWTADGTFTGDINGDRILDANEVAGDIDNNGVIDGSEISGDMNGDGVINEWEVMGDPKGNSVISNVDITSVSELGKRNVGFDVYPNPVLDNLTVNYAIEGSFNSARVDVYDLLGQRVESHMINNNNGSLKLNVSALHTGVYFYAIKVNEETIKTERVIVR